MKKVMIISALVLSVVVSAFSKDSETGVKVLATKMDVVYFKISCHLIGATIEVRDETGKVIASEVVLEKKVIVDFFAEPSGNYTIHVVKDGKDEAINFHKETSSHADIPSNNFVTVTQM